MSSIRLFVLSSFDKFGPMHGHRLRLEAERKHVNMWTDITVGAVYGAMSRLASEGLLRSAGSEREGNRPTRQIYEITDQGRMALVELRRNALDEVWFKFDPFDLALTLCDPELLSDLPLILTNRLKTAQSMLAEAREVNDRASPHVGVAKQWALRHTEYRLGAEVAYLNDLLIATEDLKSGEKLSKGKKKKA